PSDTGSPSSTPTGPVEPTMPAAAKKHTVAGAKAFVKFYWDMADYAQASGDLAGLTTLTSENCDACNGGASYLKKVFAKGGHIRGGETTVTIQDASKISAGNHIAFQVKAQVKNTRQVVDYPGKVKDEVYPASTVLAQFIVDPAPGGLKIAYWDSRS
ncbi:MAG: hypothetical protein JWO76_918, partial [Nocardioides sp.]|nr:hypothetical protein [Nocardioides sp.]